MWKANPSWRSHVAVSQRALETNSPLNFFSCSPSTLVPVVFLVCVLDVQAGTLFFLEHTKYHVEVPMCHRDNINIVSIVLTYNG